MKILIVVYGLNYGGAERQAVMDANSLTHCGYRVTLAYNKKGELIHLLSERVHQYRIRYQHVFFASLQLFFHLLFNRYDIIHSHMFWEEMISVLPGKITGHNVVFNEHGMGLWKKWHHILVMKFISLFADKIITSCDANRNIRVKREKLNHKKVITIYNSFDKSNNNKFPADIPNLLRKEKKFTIGFVGRFDEVKRLLMFTDIATRLKNKIPELRIVLVGDGEKMGTVKKEIMKKNLEEYFLLPGFVLNTDEYYKSFDIFILPSRIEGFSVALLEAGASGVPAIAFDVGGNAEIIQDGITGYIIPNHDIGLLLEKVIYLYENNDWRIDMGLAARSFITDNFSVSRRLTRLTKLYKELC